MIANPRRPPALAGLAPDLWGVPDPVSLRERRCSFCHGRIEGRGLLVRRRSDGAALRFVHGPADTWRCFRGRTGPAALESIEPVEVGPTLTAEP
jgi:ribosomal protein L24E